MPTCVRCHKEVGFLGSLGFNKQTGRCGACEKANKQALDRFRLAFLDFAKDGVISPDEWAMLSIKRVEQHPRGVYLELSRKSGNGLYAVPDPMMVETVIDTLVRMANRELITPQAGGASRHIPQDVKQAVWQRDQGKCVQCGATSYLEFDHIIPHTKGGASTVNNVQLLCRKCNLEKSDRI